MPYMEQGIETYTIEGISQLMEDLHQPRFRAKQLIQWLYAKGATSYEQMTNLPAPLRQTLTQTAPLHVPFLSDKQVSSDGSRKYVLQLADGVSVETVGIPSHEQTEEGEARRLTVCFSTQVGCPMACTFCATGTEGFTRNILPGEMVQQLLWVQRDMGMRISNVVAMGQGEPFLNYQNTLGALRIMNSKNGMDIGARHITVSTCGIIRGIESFSHEPEQFTLAISLHAARQSVRNNIMPNCTSTPLPQLKEAIARYNSTSGRRASLEYLMMSTVNDTNEDLVALKEFCRGLNVHVNLLPINKVEESPLHPSKEKTIRNWIASLESVGIKTTMRHSRGNDIAGACGQLKNRKHR